MSHRNGTALRNTGSHTAIVNWAMSNESTTARMTQPTALTVCALQMLPNSSGMPTVFGRTPRYRATCHVRWPIGESSLVSRSVRFVLSSSHTFAVYPTTAAKHTHNKKRSTFINRKIGKSDIIRTKSVAHRFRTIRRLPSRLEQMTEAIRSDMFDGGQLAFFSWIRMFLSRLMPPTNV